ncbi:hypothetical protein BHS09_10375 [Myxococcus xanthus]|uniref:Uncharacterized protein n=1 Tax=Myxococcus xanthus TaxID=34 RepID=A0AAE6KRP4_MYXXA|nr:hypothetical protein BHS09_10375 [Myxococcus xanthus]QDE74635.1 hypothetical protein BHS08_10390 [Myxococcus xanthus]
MFQGHRLSSIGRCLARRAEGEGQARPLRRDAERGRQTGGELEDALDVGDRGEWVRLEPCTEADEENDGATDGTLEPVRRVRAGEQGARRQCEGSPLACVGLRGMDGR